MMPWHRFIIYKNNQEEIYYAGTLQEIINMAEESNFCVPAFNFYNAETAMGIMNAAEELRAPVILQIYPV